MLLSHSAVTQTLIAANLPDSLWRVAADLLARAGASGACALPLVELGDPAQALDALQQLRDRGLLVVDVVGVEVGGDPARAWVVAWLPAFAGVGAAVTRRGVTGNVSSDGSLFVCSDPSLDSDLNIKTNKQTARAHAHTHAHACEGEGAPAAVAADVAAVSAPVVTGNITSDGGSVAAAPAVVTGNISSEGAPASAWDRFVASLAAQGEARYADMLEGSSAVEQGDVWIVRLAGRGSAWVDWLRDRAGRRLADWFGREIGRPVALEFAQAGGDD